MTRGVWLLAVALLAGLVLGGCSIDLGSDPFAPPEAGPPPPARPGSYVWVVGAPDLVVGSADGGATWQVRSRRSDGDIMHGDLWAVAFGDANHGWAVRRGVANPEATVLATRDAGTTWAWQRPGIKRGKLLSVAAADAAHVWAVGSQRVSGSPADDVGLVLASADGGVTWQRRRVPAGLVPYSVAFGDSRHGWLVASKAATSQCRILSTVDGGTHWRVSYAPGVTIASVAAVGPNNCWIVGNRWHPQAGYVARTTDGGRHWTADTSVASEPLRSVSFPDAEHGWAVGPNGTVLATSDGGASWTAQDGGGGYQLEQVSFSDLEHGWALIGHVALLATLDGGQSWSVVRPTNQREVFTALTTVEAGK